MNKINAATINLVKSFEGLRLTAYKCPAGVWTIGYGHTQGVSRGMRITEARANEMLASDIADAGKDVLRLVSVPLNDNQYGALCSFVFNLGAGALQTSTLRKNLNAGDYAGVPAQMARWNKATVNGKKVVFAGLVRRREAEGKLWIKK